MSEVVGTNSNGVGVAGTGSTYGVLGSSTAAFAGVVGTTSTAAPGLYGQTTGSGPGLLAICGLDVLVGNLDNYATELTTKYSGYAAILAGNVAILSALQVSRITTPVEFEGNVDMDATLTVSTGGQTASIAATNSGSWPCEAINGTSANGHGVHGVNQAGAGTTPDAGCGVWGESDQGIGVYGASKTGNAGQFQGNVSVSGQVNATTSSSTASILGTNNGGGNAGQFEGNVSVSGQVNATASSSAASILGTNNGNWPCVAIEGTSANGHGLHGINQGGAGNTPTYGCGVWGESDQGIGVYGASKSGNAGQFEGNVSVSGNVVVTGDVQLTGADCAERFTIAPMEVAEPGTVMVIGDDGRLQQSAFAYDRRVAGVVSGAGSFEPGIVLDKHGNEEARATIGLVGKVYCRVDATTGPIRVGDLLTTSDTLGHAMSAKDPIKAIGAIIGKALQPLPAGRGLLPILIALQ